MKETTQHDGDTGTVDRGTPLIGEVVITIDDYDPVTVPVF